MIDAECLSNALGIDVAGASFAELGLVDASQPDTLTFLDDPRFIRPLVENPNIAGVLSTSELVSSIKSARTDIVTIEHEDPRWAYFTLYNYIAERNRREWPSEISQMAQVHPAAVIAGRNVRIGRGTVIGAKVVVLPDVEIGEDCIIQPGTVIGSVGFEIKRTSRGPLSVIHDGMVRIGDRVEIGANSCIDTGFRNNPTIIDDEARIDNLVHVAHGVRIGRAAFVVAGTVLGGSSTIGEEAWLSINASVAPGITVGERGFVSMASAVTRDVPPGTQVTGNFAVPHEQFLRLFKSWLASQASTGSSDE